MYRIACCAVFTGAAPRVPFSQLKSARSGHGHAQGCYDEGERDHSRCARAESKRKPLTPVWPPASAADVDPVHLCHPWLVGVASSCVRPRTNERTSGSEPHAPRAEVVSIPNKQCLGRDHCSAPQGGSHPNQRYIRQFGLEHFAVSVRSIDTNVRWYSSLVCCALSVLCLRLRLSSG